MKLQRFSLIILAAFSCSVAGAGGAAAKPGAAGVQAASTEDPYLWLEEVTSDKALDWVKARNSESAKAFAESESFRQLEANLLENLDSNERIPFINKDGPYYYNFWRDARNPRGVWRRTTLAEYRKAKPKWDAIIDVDALGRDEQQSWVWRGAAILRAGGYRHVLVKLSRGGADAGIVREYDLKARSFVKGGFELPEAKGGLSWIDKDTVYVSTDFGPGSMTTSGYPRIVKRWKRGTPLASAEVVFEGKDSDMSVSASFDDTRGFERHFVYRTIAFYKSECFLRDRNGHLQKIEVPEDASSWTHREWLFVELRSPWTVGTQTYAPGSLLVTRFADFMKGERDFTLLFEPTATTSLAGTSSTRHHLFLNVLDDVKNKLIILTPGKHGWKRTPMQDPPGLSAVSASAVDPQESDDFFMTTTGYLTPTTLLRGTIGKPAEKLKALPAFFDASGLDVSQHFATSKDGTKIPYFQIARKDLRLDGTNPTILYGYGGFEVSQTPAYSGGIGRGWLSRGGVYVVANIRGGGEYGPAWHQAALKANRLRAYEDFAAVAEDLIARRVTSAQHLGAMGGSNGGLLMGNMITLYPQLFAAIACQVPLLDMKRYTKLLAGASWIAEYGDPDKPDEWAFVRRFSPYQNLKADTRYPSVLFTTSTRDDRVHPGHARKMMAKMKALGADVYLFENVEGGHGGSSTNAQAAHVWALTYTFLWQKLSAP